MGNKKAAFSVFSHAGVHASHGLCLLPSVEFCGGSLFFQNDVRSKENGKRLKGSFCGGLCVFVCGSWGH